MPQTIIVDSTEVTVTHGAFNERAAAQAIEAQLKILKQKRVAGSGDIQKQIAALEQ